jgi:outer membrane biosynthesis protein TonB
VVRVAPDGHPTDLKIVHAEPLGVFEGAVRRALMKWRYEVSGAADSSAPLTTAYQLRFSISGVTSSAAPPCVTMTASNTCQPL